MLMVLMGIVFIVIGIAIIVMNPYMHRHVWVLFLFITEWCVPYLK